MPPCPVVVDVKKTEKLTRYFVRVSEGHVKRQLGLDQIQLFLQTPQLVILGLCSCRR